MLHTSCSVLQCGSRRMRPPRMSLLQSCMPHFCCSVHYPLFSESLLHLSGFSTKVCLITSRFPIQCSLHGHHQGWGKGACTMGLSASDSHTIHLGLCPLCSQTLSGHLEFSFHVGCSDRFSPAFWLPVPCTHFPSRIQLSKSNLVQCGAGG